MSEEYGNDIVTIMDEEGNEFVLELLDTIEFEGRTYLVFLPADIDEDDEDYGYIFLRSDLEDGEDVLVSLDNEEEESKVYEHYIELILEDE